ncbi:LPS-assembly protein LptD [Zoogloea sp.]|uniref:LPS-assembly protein LptD n=1 Tax=Zoogloea sp. TaxID=49181 RepID=UPI0035AF00BA
MKPPRTQLRFLSIALFALWGRAGAEALPPFVVSPALLGPVPAAAPADADAAQADRRSARPAVARPVTPKAEAVVAKPAEPRVALDKPADRPVAPAPGRVSRVATAPAPAKPPKTGITVITAEKVSGLQDVDAVAEGSAELVRDAARFEGDRLQYFELTDEVEATGNVRVTRGGDTMTGPHMRMKVEEQVGAFDSPEYVISRPGRPAPPGQILLPGQSVPRAQQPLTGHGSAEKLYLEGENQFRFLNGTWTSCKPDRPDWYLRANELELDYDREVGEAKGGTLVFKGVPLGYMPWADFPLSEARRSGVLSPTFGTSNKVGVDLSVPYYFNLAPNYDDTLTLRYMGLRGLQVRNETRYVTPTYRGLTLLEYLPNDQVEQRSRYAGSIRHDQTFGNGWTGNINFGGISDPRYFTDLSTRVALTSTVNIPRQGSLTYAGGGWWTVTGMLQSFQNLPDPVTGVRTEPYKRLPQITLNALRPDILGPTTFHLASEFVSFSHPTQTEGRRLTFYPQLSLPLQTSAFYVTPKIGVHATQYDLDYRGTPTGDTSQSRTLPIISVDSGVTFERDTTFGGRNYIQTLEPRVYYLYVPYTDQSRIPNFDSGFYDFNFAQIFAENVYTGGDRISNANQVTTAVQSRLIDPETGAERVRAALGQRYYLVDQRVALNDGAPMRTGKQADLLAAFSATFMPKFQFDTAWQYNPRDNWTERFNIGVRFQPAYARAVSVNWRYKHNYSADPTSPDGFRDLDISGQWPLWGNWYGVGRYNRNLRDHRLTQGIAGLEYNAGCWVFRSVIQQLVTTSNDNNRSFFFQLEFNGAGSIGSSPLEMLKRNVPGYGKINGGTVPYFGAEDEDY